MASCRPESHSPDTTGWFDSRSATNRDPRFARTSELSVSARPLAGYGNVQVTVPPTGLRPADHHRRDPLGVSSGLTVAPSPEVVTDCFRCQSEKNVNNMYVAPAANRGTRRVGR